MSWDITPLYFFSWNFISIQQKELIKVQIWWNFTWAAEKSHFDGLLLSRSYKVPAKKVQKSYLSWQWRMIQGLKKIWVLFSNMTWGIWWILMRAVESLKIFTFMGLFCKKYWMVELKKQKNCVVKSYSCFKKWHKKFGEFSHKKLKAMLDKSSVYNTLAEGIFF